MGKSLDSVGKKAAVAVMVSLVLVGATLGIVGGLGYFGSSSTGSGQSTTSPNRPGVVHCYACQDGGCRLVSTDMGDTCPAGEFANDHTCGGTCSAATKKACYECQGSSVVRVSENQHKCENWQSETAAEVDCSDVPAEKHRLYIHNYSPEKVWIAMIHTSNSSSTETPFNGLELEPGATKFALLPYGWNGVVWARTGCAVVDGAFQCDSCDCANPTASAECDSPNVSFACSQVEFNIAGATIPGTPGTWNYNISNVNGVAELYAMQPDPNYDCVSAGGCLLSGGIATQSVRQLLAQGPELSKVQVDGNTVQLMAYQKKCFFSADPIPESTCNEMVNNPLPPPAQVTKVEAWGCSGPLAQKPQACATLNGTAGFNDYSAFVVANIPRTYSEPYSDAAGNSGFSSGIVDVMHIVVNPLPQDP